MSFHPQAGAHLFLVYTILIGCVLALLLSSITCPAIRELEILTNLIQDLGFPVRLLHANPSAPQVTIKGFFCIPAGSSPGRFIQGF